jgi:hypothetical protein
MRPILRCTTAPPRARPPSLYRAQRTHASTEARARATHTHNTHRQTHTHTILRHTDQPAIIISPHVLPHPPTYLIVVVRVGRQRQRVGVRIQGLVELLLSCAHDPQVLVRLCVGWVGSAWVVCLVWGSVVWCGVLWMWMWLYVALSSAGSVYVCPVMQAPMNKHHHVEDGTNTHTVCIARTPPTACNTQWGRQRRYRNTHTHTHTPTHTLQTNERLNAKHSQQVYSGIAARSQLAPWRSLRVSARWRGGTPHATRPGATHS